ncbi:ADP-heptose:LPS heptosyltransferase [Herbaspirillum sp. GW103]|uniref:lipopolysaccharide heptosyltransferase I n=1 Tax=Herbaspirillum sp. GW103 TaxID=1175306 RepID=UPI00025E50E6|nr:ADP-heptose:LPS heptosyltransferase [Herbaspirillum sp. GW103]
MKILIVRVSSLGDVVHNMPMVADIHRHFPGAQIDWVVEEGYTSLVGLNRHVHQIIPIALRRWRKTLFSTATRAEIGAFRRQLQTERYDVVFDTQGLLKTSVVMRMARLAPQGRRIGLANATEGSGYEALSRIFHDQSIPVGLRTHAVTRARLVAAGALGYRLEGLPDFALQPPDPARWAWMPEQPYVVFLHGTARAAKQWPQDRWIALGQALAGRGLPVLLPWGNAREQEAARQLAADIPGAIVLPALPMMQAVALVQQARLVIGLDTGLTHIAAAYGKPTVELYCDSPRWKTEGNWSPAIGMHTNEDRPAQ